MEKEVEYLSDFVRKGRKSARELTRARVLLLVNQGRTEMEIKDTFGISRATISNIKKRYREEGLQSALTEKTRPGQPKKYTERHEAEIIAQACTKSSSASLVHGRSARSETLFVGSTPGTSIKVKSSCRYLKARFASLFTLWCCHFPSSVTNCSRRSTKSA